MGREYQRNCQKWTRDQTRPGPASTDTWLAACFGRACRIWANAALQGRVSMFINRHVRVLGLVTVCLLGSSGVDAQEGLPALATVKSVKCTFPILATGTWRNGKPEATVKPAGLSLEFDSVNLDEGTAVLLVNVGGTASQVRYSRAAVEGDPAFRAVVHRRSALHHDDLSQRDARREAASRPHAT